MNTIQFLDSLSRDLRYAGRAMNRVLLKPLSYPRAENWWRSGRSRLALRDRRRTSGCSALRSPEQSVAQPHRRQWLTSFVTQRLGGPDSHGPANGHVTGGEADKREQASRPHEYH
jgi:hypothetical protein